MTRRIKIGIAAVACIVSFIAALAAVAVAIQTKCAIDTRMYALSFDCSQPKEVIRFLMFWKPQFFP